jgi:hypothetical protein
MDHPWCSRERVRWETPPEIPLLRTRGLVGLERASTLQDQGDTFERETPFASSEVGLKLNIHGVAFFLKQSGQHVRWGAPAPALMSCFIASNIAKRPAEYFASHAVVLSFVAGDKDDRCKCGIIAARVFENVCGDTASKMSPKSNMERVRNGGHVTRSTRLDRASEIFGLRLAGCARGCVICCC